MTILNTFEYVIGTPEWLTILLFGLSIIFLFGEIISVYCGKWKQCLGCAFFALVLIASGLIALDGAKEVETRYECAIDKKTPFVEIVDNYDIIDRRGDIWILRDKEEK